MSRCAGVKPRQTVLIIGGSRRRWVVRRPDREGVGSARHGSGQHDGQPADVGDQDVIDIGAFGEPTQQRLEPRTADGACALAAVDAVILPGRDAVPMADR